MTADPVRRELETAARLSPYRQTRGRIAAWQRYALDRQWLRQIQDDRLALTTAGRAALGFRHNLTPELTAGAEPDPSSTDADRVLDSTPAVTLAPASRQ